MGLFFKKHKEQDESLIAGEDIFFGFTDWHCHILPGVDDGVQTMEESLAVLEQYEKWGVRNVWLTPHIMEDIPNTTQHLRERFAELQTAYDADRNRRQGEMEEGVESGAASGSGSADNATAAGSRPKALPKPVQLHLAAENMMDNLFQERLAARDLLPITTAGDHLLVETSYFNPPIQLYDILLAVREAGFQPILAHPERYVYMEMRDYERLKGMGIKFQMNLFSQTGRYGKDVIKKMNKLLDKHWYNYVGTDLHRISMLGGVDALRLRSF